MLKLQTDKCGSGEIFSVLEQCAPEKLVVLLRDVSGKTLFSTTLTNLPKGTSERKLGLDGSKLPRGVYGIQVVGLPNSKSAGIIVVK